MTSGKSCIVRRMTTNDSSFSTALWLNSRLAAVSTVLVASELLFHLVDTCKRESAGLVTARCGYHPPDDRHTVLGPSAAFTQRNRVKYPLAKKYAARMPDIAVEVASFCNPYEWIARNCRNICSMVRRWFGLAFQTSKAWKSVNSMNTARSKTNSSARTAASPGEDVLPGFSLELATLFA